MQIDKVGVIQEEGRSVYPAQPPESLGETLVGGMVEVVPPIEQRQRPRRLQDARTKEEYDTIIAETIYLATTTGPSDRPRRH